MSKYGDTSLVRTLQEDALDKIVLNDGPGAEMGATTHRVVIDPK